MLTKKLKHSCPPHQWASSFFENASYRARVANVALTSAENPSSQVLRNLEVGETVEMISAPITIDNVCRIQVRSSSGEVQILQNIKTNLKN